MPDVETTELRNITKERAFGESIGVSGHHEMKILVEFYGVVRRRTGRSHESLEFGDTSSCRLIDVLHRLAENHEELRLDCLVRRADGDWELSPHIIANLNGKRFTRQGDDSLVDGDSLLLLSADVGG